MARAAYESVDEYLAAQPRPARQVLERVRAAIRKALPGAVDRISYGIPMYALDGRMVLYFAGFRHHWSIYPATPRVVGALRDELAGRVHSKATLRFSYDEAVPTRLVARIAKLRAAEVADREVAVAGPTRGRPRPSRPARAGSPSASGARPSARAPRGSRARPERTSRSGASPRTRPRGPTSGGR
jgi:uncharacterized protein YdhG (YjbR/CyaY superfamily)